MLSLTGAGRDILARGAAVHAETIRTLLPDRLTPEEQELLARALTRVAAGDPAAPEEESWPSQPRSA